MTRQVIAASFAALTLMGGIAVAAEASEHFALAKVCVRDPVDDKFYLDLDNVACTALQNEGGCKSNPALVPHLRKQYLETKAGDLPGGAEGARYDRGLWLAILAGRDPDLNAVRLPGCAAGPLTIADLAQPGCVRVACTTYKPGTPAPTPQADGAAKPPRIRQSAAELWKTTAAAKPASLNFNQDLDGDADNISARIALGLPFQWDTAGPGNNPLSLVPYLALESVQNDSGEDSTNLSAGARLIYQLEPVLGNTGWSHLFQLDLNALSDEEAESLLLNGVVSYAPLPNTALFTSGVDVFSLPLRLRTDNAFLGEFGHVSDAGDKPELLSGQEYLRAGGRIGFTLLSVHDGDDKPWWSGLSLGAGYKYLYGFEGPVRNFDQFEARLGYTFPSAPNFGLELTYFNGRLDRTLEKSERLTAGMTVKF